MRIKKIVLIVIGILVLLLLGLFIFATIKKQHSISPLEETYIKKLNEDINDLVFIFDSEEIDDTNYITYAMYQNYLNTGKTEMKNDAIINFIKEELDYDINKEDIKNNVMSPIMNESYIRSNEDNTGYTINFPNDNYASVPLRIINKYLLTDIKKEHDDFIVTYQKYEIKNPYEVLNYYTENKASDEVLESIDNYLAGKMPVIKFLKYVNDDNIERVGKKVSSMELTYTIKDDKLLIK